MFVLNYDDIIGEIWVNDFYAASAHDCRLFSKYSAIASATLSPGSYTREVGF